MTQGSDTTGETSEKLRAELDKLLRQHEQYSMALDAAMDPRTSLRLQRTLERLDEEIEGLKEALQGYGSEGDAPRELPPPMQGVVPEWGDEEEPATSIYDPEQGLGPDPSSLVPSQWGAKPSAAPAPAPAAAAAPGPAGAVQQPAMYTDSVPTQPRSPDSPTDPSRRPTAKLSDPGSPSSVAIEPSSSLTEDPPTTVLPSSEPSPPAERPNTGPQASISSSQLSDVMNDLATPTGRKPSVSAPSRASSPPADLASGPAAAADSLSRQEQDFEEMSTLIGDELEEPRWGHTEIVPPSPSERVGPTGPHATVPQAGAATPGAGPGAAPDAPGMPLPGNAPSSPFGAPAQPPSSPFDQPGGAGQAASPSSPLGVPAVGQSSPPFGYPAPPPSASNSTPFGRQPTGFDYITPTTTDSDSEDWPFWSRALLVLVVLAFLGAAGWILFQGP